MQVEARRDVFDGREHIGPRDLICVVAAEKGGEIRRRRRQLAHGKVFLGRGAKLRDRAWAPAVFERAQGGDELPDPDVAELDNGLHLLVARDDASALGIVPGRSGQHAHIVVRGGIGFDGASDHVRGHDLVAGADEHVLGADAGVEEIHRAGHCVARASLARLESEENVAARPADLLHHLGRLVSHHNNVVANARVLVPLQRVLNDRDRTDLAARLRRHVRRHPAPDAAREGDGVERH